MQVMIKTKPSGKRSNKNYHTKECKTDRKTERRVTRSSYYSENKANLISI